MVDNRAPRRSAVNCSNPLLDIGVLQNVRSYVGPGHCLFVAPVSKRWDEMYSTLGSQQLTVREESGEQHILTGGFKVTLYSHAFASPSRVKLAREWA